MVVLGGALNNGWSEGEKIRKIDVGIASRSAFESRRRAILSLFRGLRSPLINSN
jgi:hypothetical protein